MYQGVKGRQGNRWVPMAVIWVRGGGSLTLRTVIVVVDVEVTVR